MILHNSQIQLFNANIIYSLENKILKITADLPPVTLKEINTITPVSSSYYELKLSTTQLEELQKLPAPPFKIPESENNNCGEIEITGPGAKHIEIINCETRPLETPPREDQPIEVIRCNSQKRLVELIIEFYAPAELIKQEILLGDGIVYIIFVVYFENRKKLMATLLNPNNYEFLTDSKNTSAYSSIKTARKSQEFKDGVNFIGKENLCLVGIDIKNKKIITTGDKEIKPLPDLPR
jgi:hypothetical protein